MSPEQLIFIARQHLEAGAVAQAEDLCRLVLRDDPTRTAALHLLAIAAARGGRNDQAIALFRKAIEANLNAADVYADFAQVLHAVGRDAEAIAAYGEALKLNAQLVTARAGLGDLHRHHGDHNLAIREYHAALTINESLAEVHNNLGMSLAADKQLDAAIAAYGRAIALKPELVNAHYNLANAYRSREQLPESIAAYRRAITLRPDFAEAHNNLGDTLEAGGDIAGAIAAYDESIRLYPDKPEPRWNRSLAYLINGDYARGWPEYEWRHRRATAVPRHLGPRWDGEELSGKTILLHAEQGLGDTLQFVRYVPMVIERGGRVILECQPPLVRQLSGNSKDVEVIPAGLPLPRYDVQCPLMSLAMVFETRLDSLPNPVAYLTADADLVDRWSQRLGSRRCRRIGIAWAGKRRSSIRPQSVDASA